MNISIPLYNYLSEKLGSEDAVRTRRLLYSLVDYVSSTKHFVRMTSGSKGEGLDMEGSDLDIMLLFNNIHIYETTPDDIPPDSFIMSTKTTRPGFTHLQACGKINPILGIFCLTFQNQLCLPSKSAPLFCANIGNVGYPPLVVHGPCVSPSSYDEDYAITLRCRSWISQGHQWATRDRVWPSSELVSKITDFGVLFVPIGCKRSPNEFLEWRISFSAAEKLIVYSFSHTQLLCYGLLKLLLKEIIEQNETCKGLLCSYFLKTVVFWVSESLPVSNWRPDNIASCFMQVLKRLLYFVEYNYLPHYFITDNNLFENRFDLEQQAALKSVLTRLYQMDIYCMEQSKTVSKFFHTVEPISNNIKIMDEQNLTEKIHVLIRKQQDDFLTLFLTPKTAPEKLLTLQKHNKLKSYNFLYSVTFYDVLQTLGSKHILRTTGNKFHYTDGHKKYFPYLLCGRKTDAVSGWLTIASYFYNMKRYQIVIDIMDHALKQCTPDKLYYPTNALYRLSDIKDVALHCNHLSAGEIYRRNVVRLQRSSYISSVTIPELTEWGFHSSVPSHVYARFLQFLCFHHLSDYVRCIDALEDLQVTVTSKCFITHNWQIATSSICLGIAYNMVGDRDKARSCFKKAAESGFYKQYKI